MKEYKLTFTVYLPDTAEDPAALREFILKERKVAAVLCGAVNTTLHREGCAIKGQRVRLEETT
jgi:hypothetical protein